MSAEMDRFLAFAFLVFVSMVNSNQAASKLGGTILSIEDNNIPVDETEVLQTVQPKFDIAKIISDAIKKVVAGKGKLGAQNGMKDSNGGKYQYHDTPILLDSHENQKRDHVTADVCPKENGFCVLPNGGDQNSGVIKLDSVDGNSLQQQAKCLAKCRARIGATGCEEIWNQGNRGCYVHTQVVARGNGVGNHACWIFSKCKRDVESACPKENGFCVLPNGGDQNAGVVKLDAVDGNTPQQQAKCLAKCRAHPGATGCEEIWNQGNRGCYVHTSVVARGNGVGNHACWIFSKCKAVAVMAVAEEAVCPKENGFCVLPNGGDQNSGVVKLDSIDGNTVLQQARCLAKCRGHEGATGCEEIWNQGNRGCYVHTSLVARGNGVGNHACWVFSKCRASAPVLLPNVPASTTIIPPTTAAPTTAIPSTVAAPAPTTTTTILPTTAGPQYMCSFVPGYGGGGVDMKIGNQKEAECIKICETKKLKDDSINGVTVRAGNKGGCWCEKRMRGVVQSTTYKTCFLFPIAIAVPTTGRPDIVVYPTLNSSAGAVSLSCDETNMTASFDEKILPGNLLNITMSGCRDGSYVVKRNRVSTNFKDCVMNITQSRDQITQENIVEVTNGVPDPTNTVQRVVVHYYKLQCIFDRHLNVRIGVAVHIKDKIERYGQVKITNFEASMVLYQSQSFVVKAPTPLEVTAFEPIYMQILGINNNGLFKFITESCFATPSGNPRDGTKYLFFDDKCPIDPTFRQYTSNGRNRFRFSVNAFTFIRLKSSVYFHCNLLVCKKDTTTEECTQRCNKLNNKREIATGDDTVGRITITSGQIRWKKPVYDVKFKHVAHGDQLTIFIPEE